MSWLVRPIHHSRLTAVQALVCAVAGLGFAFDLYESLMMALIVSPVLTTVGHLTPGTPAFNKWVGLFFGQTGRDPGLDDRPVLGMADGEHGFDARHERVGRNSEQTVGLVGQDDVACQIEEPTADVGDAL